MARKKKSVAKRKKPIAKMSIPKEDVWNYFCGFFDDLDLIDYTLNYSNSNFRDMDMHKVGRVGKDYYVIFFDQGLDELQSQDERIRKLIRSRNPFDTSILLTKYIAENRRTLLKRNGYYQKNFYNYFFGIEISVVMKVSMINYLLHGMPNNKILSISERVEELQDRISDKFGEHKIYFDSISGVEGYKLYLNKSIRQITFHLCVIKTEKFPMYE